MPDVPSQPHSRALPPSPAAAWRFAGVSLVGLAMVLLVGVVLNVLLLRLSPERPAGTHESIVGFLLQTADKVGWLILVVMVAWLLVRRCLRLAVCLAVITAGSHVIAVAGPALLLLIGRTPGASVFNAQTGATVTVGALLLVFLPVIPRQRRGWALAVTGILTAAMAVLSVRAGAAGPYAALIATLLAVVWLAVTALAYSRWRGEAGLQPRTLTRGLSPEDWERLVLAPGGQSPVAAGWRGIGLMIASALAIGGVLVGLGLLVTRVLVQVQQVDSAVLHWFAGHRTPSLSTVALAFDVVGNTPGIVSVLLVAVPLALAITRRFAPAVFLLAAAVGETTLYLAVGAVVGRQRPSVDHLWLTVPPTSSFPSGHVAATLVTYGGIALLILAWGRGRLRYLAAVVAAFLVLGVVFARLYWGMHFPTDVLASVLFGSAWLAVCWRTFRPQRGAVPLLAGCRSE